MAPEKDCGRLIFIQNSAQGHQISPRRRPQFLESAGVQLHLICSSNDSAGTVTTRSTCPMAHVLLLQLFFDERNSRLQDSSSTGPIFPVPVRNIQIKTSSSCASRQLSETDGINYNRSRSMVYQVPSKCRQLSQAHSKSFTAFPLLYFPQTASAKQRAAGTQCGLPTAPVYQGCGTRPGRRPRCGTESHSRRTHGTGRSVQWGIIYGSTSIAGTTQALSAQ